MSMNNVRVYSLLDLNVYSRIPRKMRVKPNCTKSLYSVCNNKRSILKKKSYLYILPGQHSSLNNDVHVISGRDTFILLVKLQQ